MYLEEFKNDIRINSLSFEQLFQKYFIDKSTFYFEKFSTNDEYALKAEIANLLNIQINDIYIIGSGKLGYSIKPKHEGRVFDGIYIKTNKLKDRSDIDIAIVNTKLFDEVQENIYDWSNGFKEDWNQNSYYMNNPFNVSLKYKFLEYLGKGWYRPDFAPNGFKIETGQKDFKKVKNTWSKKLNRNIAFAIYKNWHFFKKYQLETLEKFAIKVKQGEI